MWFADRRADFKPILSRHHHIQQKGIVGNLLGHVKGLSPIRGGVNSISAALGIGFQHGQDLEMILAIIHENFRNITNVGALIRVTGFAETDCTRLFCTYMKMTPMEYIRRYRIKIACQLLMNTNLSVTEISEQCNMNLSYLCKKVREITGFSPLEYRRNHWRKQNE